MLEITGDLKRKIEFTPAWDKKERDLGIHSVEIKFLVSGKHGAVQFLIYTGWFLPENDVNMKPIAADLGYHSYRPLYDGQEVMQKDCSYLDGKPCYYEGSGLHAEKPWELLLKHGEEKLWEYLELQYKETLYGEDND